jgi:hypothetical protein
LGKKRFYDSWPFDKDGVAFSFKQVFEAGIQCFFDGVQPVAIEMIYRAVCTVVLIDYAEGGAAGRFCDPELAAHFGYQGGFAGTQVAQQGISTPTPVFLQQAGGYGGKIIQHIRVALHPAKIVLQRLITNIYASGEPPSPFISSISPRY